MCISLNRVYRWISLNLPFEFDGFISVAIKRCESSNVIMNLIPFDLSGNILERGWSLQNYDEGDGDEWKSYLFMSQTS